MSRTTTNRCDGAELACAYVLQALPSNEIAAAEAHIASCADCRRELTCLRGVVNHFVAWPTDVLRPTQPLQSQLARRIAGQTAKQPDLPAAPDRSEPEWDEVAPGIECKILAADPERERVSMLVRLSAGARYPAHVHAGVEELHLLSGELWIDRRKLLPGDYNYGSPGAGDDLVWTETGCTCVLITSSRDRLP